MQTVFVFFVRVKNGRNAKGNNTKYSNAKGNNTKDSNAKGNNTNYYITK